MKWIASVIITLAILYLRAPDIWPARFWAEDLNFFLFQAQHDGAISFIKPYAGYLHAVPRLISLASLAFPTTWTPEVFLFFVLLFTGWSASIVARSIGGFAGILAGSSFVLANGWSEPIGSVTNLQWLLAPTLLLLAVRPDRVSRPEGIAFSLLAAMSGPFTIAFAPIYLFVIGNDFLNRRKVNFPALIAVASAPIQFLEVIFTPNNTPPPHGIRDTAWLFGRIVELSAGGGKLVALSAIALCCVTAILGKDRLRRALLITASLLLTAMVVAKFRHDPDIFVTGLVGHRYWYVQGVIWLLVAFSAIREHGLVTKASGTFAAAILVATNIYASGLSPRAWFNAGGGWADAVEQSYSSPVRFEYAPNWAVRLERGIVYRPTSP
jgi:hypothetical protein